MHHVSTSPTPDFLQRGWIQESFWSAWTVTRAIAASHRCGCSPKRWHYNCWLWQQVGQHLLLWGQVQGRCINVGWSFWTMTASFRGHFHAYRFSNTWKQNVVVFCWLVLTYHLLFFTSIRQSLALVDWWGRRVCPWTRMVMWSWLTTRHALYSSSSWPASSSLSLVVEATVTSNLQVEFVSGQRHSRDE